MIPLRQALSSSVGGKLITALTGLGLVLFTLAHLAGNLTLLAPPPESGPSAFNQYAQGLHELGALVYIAEIGLLFLFGIHIVNGILLTIRNRKARSHGYVRWQSKGATQSNIASRNMALSGLVLAGFTILHVLHFRFGPGVADGYVTEINGKQARDLHLLVFETFQSPGWVAFYVGAMLFLWMHVKHGFWSAFQSIGAMNPRWSLPISVASWVLAALLAIGFILLPLWLYFNVPGALK